MRVVELTVVVEEIPVVIVELFRTGLWVEKLSIVEDDTFFSNVTVDEAVVVDDGLFEFDPDVLLVDFLLDEDAEVDLEVVDEDAEVDFGVFDADDRAIPNNPANRFVFSKNLPA